MSNFEDWIKDLAADKFGLTEEQSSLLATAILESAGPRAEEWLEYVAFYSGDDEVIDLIRPAYRAVLGPKAESLGIDEADLPHIYSEFGGHLP